MSYAIHATRAQRQLDRASAAIRQAAEAKTLACRAAMIRTALTNATMAVESLQAMVGPKP